MTFRLTALFASSLLLLAATPARALTIVGYSPDVNDRFDSGYPSAPVPNSSLSFLGSGYDLSGVGWNPSLTSQSFAMISDEYFVYANHYAAGSTMSFHSPTSGTVVNYAVSGTTYHFTYNGGTSDFAIGKLATPLDPADGIAYYPILALAQASDYVGRDVLIYGHDGGSGGGPRLGENTGDLVLTYDLGGGPNSSIGLAYRYDSGLAGDSLFQGGDSSSPTFTLWNGQLALVGTHSAVGTLGANQYSIDNLIAAYLSQMSGQGIEFTVVPEPARVLLLLLGACALLRRRHRACPHE